MSDIQQVTCFQTADNTIHHDYNTALKHSFNLFIVELCAEMGLTSEQDMNVAVTIKNNAKKLFEILEEMRDNDIL